MGSTIPSHPICSRTWSKRQRFRRSAAPARRPNGPPALASAGSPYRQLQFSAIQLLHLTLPLSHHPGRSAPSLPSACFQKVWMALNLGGDWMSSTAHLENSRTRRQNWVTLGQVD